jgi:chloride channel protein, CIC family
MLFMSLAFVQERLRTWWQPRKGLAIAEASAIGFVAAISALLLKVSSGWLGTWRVHTSHLLPAWIVLPIIGLVFGYIAGFLVQRLAPEAAGGGVPQVKASLANIPIKLSWRVAAVKLVSAAFVIGSGITMGRQAPTVHLGAALAGGMSRLVPTSPEHRRQMIAAGAGAGLAATFNAPIAGVIFIVEELLQDLSGITLGTAIIASFIGGVISRLLGGGSLDLNSKLMTYSANFTFPQIPFFLLLGLLAGLLGAWFNRGLLISNKLYSRLHVSLPLRVALAGLISGLVVAFLPEAFRDNSGLREYVVTEKASASIAALAFVAQFFLTILAFGSGAPGGLFAPSLILGCCLGHMVGVLEQYVLGTNSASTYALAGMGAFFSAVSKVPITAIVIVFEMTTNFNLVLPLMVVCVTSYLVSDKVMPGSLYDKLLKLNGITIQKDNPIDSILTKLTAAEVMQPQVETLDISITVGEAVDIFSRSTHRGFPVLEEGKLVGIVTQNDLLKIRDLNLSAYATLTEIMTSQPVVVEASHNLSNVLYMLDRYNISRLPVIDGRRLIGIITRADIIKAEANCLNGIIKGQIGPKPEPSYVVYQTRCPSVGRGRLLVPVANPDTIGTLLKIAATIARDRHYEIDCIQIMLVSRQSSPSETTVRTTKSRRLLRQAEAIGKKYRIPVHTQIRVSHDIAETILETIKERHINLLLMGWKGNTSTPGRIFGDVVDTLIRNAPCDVMLVKLGQNPSSSLLPSSSTTQFNKWLIPMAGGPNAWVAIKLLPALVTLGDNPKIRLTRVFQPSEIEPDMTVLEEAIRQLIRSPKLSTTVIAAPIKANTVSEGVINLVKAENYDVVILGASREGMLQQAITGNIPENIASKVDSTVILVRGAINQEK